MSILVPVAMFGWIPFTVFLFTWLHPRRASIAAFILGWLFLPNYDFVLPGIPDYSKTSAICTSILVAALIFDPDRVHNFRPSWWDLPMLLWCFSPLPSSLTNGLGLYDGIAASLDVCIAYGFPYYIGRLYLTDGRAVRELAIGIFLGGLLYVPFCLWEMRMSPQLHRQLYGFHQHSFGQSMRYGGYRPVVFMNHGLMVGMWMASAALCGVWLLRAGDLKRWYGFAPGGLVALLLVTFIFLKSTGAVLLFVLGLSSLWFASRYRKTWPMLLLVFMPLVYIGVRATNLWDGSNLVELVMDVNEDRAGSIDFRFRNEVILSKKAMQRPLFGWAQGQEYCLPYHDRLLPFGFPASMAPSRKRIVLCA